MNDRQYCDYAAGLAAQTVGHRFPHLSHGAVAYPGLGPGVVLFFGQSGPAAGGGPDPVVARLRSFLAIEEVGIVELGIGTAGGGAWALLAESRRDVEYCRRLVRKAAVESASADGQERAG